MTKRSIGHKALVYLYCVRYGFDWMSVMRFIRAKEEMPDGWEEEADAYEEAHECVSALDEEYPQALLRTFRPPFVLVDEEIQAYA